LYQVLVAEDELLTRIGVRSLVDWESLGMAIAADATNGQSAWEQYLALRPDIIITDIRMPLLDGISLIERIRQTDETVQIIVLTCLDDFSLIQAALKLGITYYIHKLSMKNEEMHEALLKAKKQLDCNKRIPVSRSLPAEELFANFINDKIDVRQFTHELLGKRQIGMPFCAALLVMDGVDGAETDDSNIMQILRQAIDLRKNGLWCRAGCNIFFYAAAESLIDSISDRIRTLLSMYLDAGALIWYSPAISDPAGLPAEYTRLLLINEMGELLKKSRKIELNDLSPALGREICLARDYIWINYAQPLNVQTIASRIGYSQNYLSGLFKRSVGIGLADYILYVRVEVAKRLLKETDKPISEIGLLTGFNSESYFTRCFKECTGTPPSLYRK